MKRRSFLGTIAALALMPFTGIAKLAGKERVIRGGCYASKSLKTIPTGYAAWIIGGSMEVGGTAQAVVVSRDGLCAQLITVGDYCRMTGGADLKRPVMCVYSHKDGSYCIVGVGLPERRVGLAKLLYGKNPKGWRWL